MAFAPAGGRGSVVPRGGGRGHQQAGDGPSVFKECVECVLSNQYVCSLPLFAAVLRQMMVHGFPKFNGILEALVKFLTALPCPTPSLFPLSHAAIHGHITGKSSRARAAE